MRDQFVFPVGVDADFADGEPLAELDQPRFGDDSRAAPAF